MKPDFDAMTKPELRAYVVAHPKDQEAFQAFVDRFTADASPVIYDLPRSQDDLKELENLIQQQANKK